MDAVVDSSHLYPVERRARHAERPGFRISELQISPTQKVVATILVCSGYVRDAASAGAATSSPATRRMPSRAAIRERIGTFRVPTQPPPGVEVNQQVRC